VTGGMAHSSLGVFGFTLSTFATRTYCGGQPTAVESVRLASGEIARKNVCPLTMLRYLLPGGPGLRLLSFLPAVAFASCKLSSC
jgi:hypothetical protein